MSLVDVKALSQTSRSPVNFSDGNRDLHLQTLYEWLPTGLLDGQVIDWTRFPSKTIGYLVNTVGDSPFAGHIALALVSSGTVWKGCSLKTRASLLYGFLCRVQHIGDIQHPEELTKEVWQELMAEQTLTPTLYSGLKLYKQLTEGHLSDYLDQLTPRQRTQVQPYFLPQIPRRLWTEQVNGSAMEEAGKRC
jgi:hypothetical protein